MRKQYYVYLITNKNNKVIYIGVTNNLTRRVYEHKNKLINGFSEKYNLSKLVYFDTFDNIREAIENEKKTKGWKRFRKIELIESTNKQWDDLSDGWY